jgi:ATP-dependent RNA helicase DHX37/DHR1
LDAFALPEVLTRPLEDVVLAMKTMNVSNVGSFPFPTPPDQNQIMSAVRLLANLGCVDVSKVEEQGGDGKITALGAAVAKLPLGVRYGKMLLVSAQANVLDYGITLVAVLSEVSPFVYQSEEVNKDSKESNNADSELEGLDEIDRNNAREIKKAKKRNIRTKWMHDGGDVLSAMMAAGAYAYAGRGSGGLSEKVACRKFCEENGLHLVVMQRIAKMRLHLCKLAKIRLPSAQGVAVETGTYLPSMTPPKRMQECLLRQAIASGLLDNVARRAPPGTLPPEFTGTRSAYICGNISLKEPLFIDNKSSMHSKLPEWVCFDSVVRKTRKDGTTVVTMQRVTPIDPEFLASLCHGSNLMALGSPLATPIPRYMEETDSIQCAVETKFGSHSWVIPPLYVDMYDMIQNESKAAPKKQNPAVVKDDSFRWFARYLLEGKVLHELADLVPLLNEEPSIITRRKPLKKVTLLVSALSDAGVDSSGALQKHWAEKNDKFLFKQLKPWVKSDCLHVAKTIWINAVKSYAESRKHTI